MGSLESCTPEAALAACGLLFGLACEPANCRQLLEEGFGGDCLAALQRFPSDHRGDRIDRSVSGVLL